MTNNAAAEDTRVVVVKQESGTREARLELDGKQVSRVVIIPMLMRLGAAVVRMDGVGGVDTAEEYRHRGYARRVMEFVVDDIRAGDAALSTLFGIQDFYQKFGYETVGPEYTVTLPFADALPAALPHGWQFRPLRPHDMSAVMQLYHANTKRASGALVRHDPGDPTETAWPGAGTPDARLIGQRAWNRLRKMAIDPGKDACRVLCDASGAVAAYAWFGANWWMGVRRRNMPRAFHLAEAMARDPVAADALLAACRLWAEEVGSRYTKLAFAIPPEGPLAAATAYQGGEVLTIYTRGGDFMARVLHIERLVQQLLPELSARVRARCLPYRGQLTLRTEDGDASLFISDPGVSTDGPLTGNHLTAELPQAILARLCLGGFDPNDVITRLPQQPDTETAMLLRALFPRRTPHIYPMDRF